MEAQTKNDGRKFLRMMSLIAALGLGTAWAVSRSGAPPVEPKHQQSDWVSDGMSEVYMELGDDRILSNPWRGLPSCIYARGKDHRDEERFFAVSVGGWNVSVSCAARGIGAQRPLKIGATAGEALWVNHMLFRPLTATPEKGGDEINIMELPIRGRVRRGADVLLTLDADAQARAQAVAECMTGHPEACPLAEIDMSRYRDRYEDAAARSIAMVEIDIRTGAIEALVSAKSPCFEADEKGEKRAGCPETPAHADAGLRKQRGLPSGPVDLALRPVHMGSIVKPVQALALLRAGQEWFDPDERLPGGKERWLDNVLSNSRSAELIKRVLCAPQDFSYPCAPFANLAQAARDLGLNRHRRRDLLLGEAISPSIAGFDDLRGGMTMQRPMRTMDADAKTRRVWEDIPPGPLDFEQARTCQARKWEGCLGEVTAELFGAGNSRGNVIDAAEMYARLAQAAADMAQAPVPHLVSEAREGRQVRTAAEAAPLDIDPAHARAILGALSTTHVSGSGKDACLAVYGDRKRCMQLEMSLKTGTPTFRHDRMSLQGRREFCRKPHLPSRARDACLAPPLKWTVMVTRRDGAYDKVIAVVAERNWRKRDGRVDAAAERGVSVSAEFALRFHRLVERQRLQLAALKP
jgi:hypothetical protein